MVRFYRFANRLPNNEAGKMNSSAMAHIHHGLGMLIRLKTEAAVINPAKIKKYILALLLHTRLAVREAKKAPAIQPNGIIKMAKIGALSMTYLPVSGAMGSIPSGSVKRL